MGKVGILIAALLLAIIAPGLALAGPPFVTDDPEPVDLGHWEVYGFSSGVHTNGDTSGSFAGVEVNYGAAPNLQLHIIAPLAFDSPSAGSLRTGPGDTELGMKYRFLNPGKDDWWPEVGIFPLVEVPTGEAGRGLVAGKFREFIPVWVQKNFDKWSTYGGGGYWINPGIGNQNYWFVGWLVQRQVTDKLAIGGELFHQTADKIDGKESSGFNVGSIYDFSGHYHLLASAGRGLQNGAATNAFSYYLAIQNTF
jgi:hypothetical protein